MNLHPRSDGLSPTQLQLQVTGNGPPPTCASLLTPTPAPLLGPPPLPVWPRPATRPSPANVRPCPTPPRPAQLSQRDVTPQQTATAAALPSRSAAPPLTLTTNGRSALPTLTDGDHGHLRHTLLYPCDNFIIPQGEKGAGAGPHFASNGCPRLIISYHRRLHVGLGLL